jgi:hypothetical protein
MQSCLICESDKGLMRCAMCPATYCLWEESTGRGCLRMTNPLLSFSSIVCWHCFDETYGKKPSNVRALFPSPSGFALTECIQYELNLRRRHLSKKPTAVLVVLLYLPELLRRGFGVVEYLHGVMMAFSIKVSPLLSETSWRLTLPTGYPGDG